MNTVDPPGGVLRDKWLRVASSFFQRWQVIGIAYVSKGHTDISQEPATLDSLDRREAK